jgi:hypothetical protein
MGMYTEFRFKAALTHGGEAALSAIFTDVERPDEPTESTEARKVAWAESAIDFLSLERADQILTAYMVNGVERPALVFDGHTIDIHTNIKNYQGEVESFLAWIAPYVDPATVVGSSHYEEWDRPAQIVAKNGALGLDYSDVHDSSSSY